MEVKVKYVWHNFVMILGYWALGFILYALLFGDVSIGDLQIGGWLK